MLTKFIERPEIRQAFKDNAVRVKIPSDIAGSGPIVPPSARNRSLVGMSFDYMARFRLAREINLGMADSDIAVWDTGWVAEQTVREMKGDERFGRAHPRWERMLLAARELYESYVSGDENDMVRIARCVQCLGAVDLITRMDGFNPNFQPQDDVTQELLDLDTVFNPLQMLRPRTLCLLNPSLPGAQCIGSGDADLVIDRTVIDIKTSAEMSCGAPLLREVASYAALLRRDGATMGGPDPVRVSVERVGLYFARYGRLMTWSLDEIFPNEGFERFADVLMDAIKDAVPSPRP